jgi:hypothetical protein
MATAPTITLGQIKDLSATLTQVIPTDLLFDQAQYWIGNKGELAEAIRQVLCGPVLDWAKVYDILGMSVEYVEFAKSGIQDNPNLWVVPVVKGITCNKVVEALRKAGSKVYTYVEDLDKNVTVNDRDPNRDGSYTIGLAKNVEADEINKDKSANMLAEANHKGITLLERLLLELAYFLATGKHLDVKNITICSGSRDSGGYVPGVDWSSGHRGVHVSWYDPDNRSGSLRSRSAVSLPS